MFRLFLLLVVMAAAAVWVEPEWSSPGRTLSLRVRTTPELVGFVRAKARELGGEAVAAMAPDRARQPSVSAPPPTHNSDDGLTEADRQRLNRLIEEKTKDRP